MIDTRPQSLRTMRDSLGNTVRRGDCLSGNSSSTRCVVKWVSPTMGLAVKMLDMESSAETGDMFFIKDPRSTCWHYANNQIHVFPHDYVDIDTQLADLIEKALDGNGLKIDLDEKLNSVTSDTSGVELTEDSPVNPDEVAKLLHNDTMKSILGADGIERAIHRAGQRAAAAVNHTIRGIGQDGVGF
jgi:hypothetical protein